jgi:hypothetical protein
MLAAQIDNHPAAVALLEVRYRQRNPRGVPAGRDRAGLSPLGQARWPHLRTIAVPAFRVKQ